MPEWQENAADFLDKMQKYHIVRKVYEAQKRDAAQYEKYVALCGEVTPRLLEAYRRKKAQAHLLALLQQEPELPFSTLKEQHVSLATVHNLEAAGLAEIRRRRVLRDSYRDAKALHEAVELTEDQRQVVARVYPAIDAARRSTSSSPSACARPASASSCSCRKSR